MQAWVLRIGIIAVIAIGAIVLRDRLSGAASELKLGDCFDEPGSAATTVKDVQHHPCNESHTAEVIYVGNHPAAKDAPIPSETDMTNYVAQVCLPAFQSYTGHSFDSEETFDIGWIYPTDDGWKDGDRGITCFAYRLDNGQMTRSIRAAPAAS